MLREKPILINRFCEFDINKRLDQFSGFHSKQKKVGVSQKSNEIIIRMVGDLKENVIELVQSLDCSESCKEQMKQILVLYTRKINKLRQERNLFKDLLLLEDKKHNEQVSRLNGKIRRLEAELIASSQSKNNSCDKCLCEDASTERFSSIFKESNIYQCCCPSKISVGSYCQQEKESFNQISKHNQPFNIKECFKNISKLQLKDEQQLLLSNDQSQPSKDNQEESVSFEVNKKKEDNEDSAKTISEEQLMKLMLKYNFSMQQLEHILDQYQTEHKMPEEMFDSQKQKKLYKLGQKMQKSIQNKKVVNDVKRLTMVKNKKK